VCDADLRTLNAGDGALVETLRETPLDEFEEPDRVAEARKHATELLDIRDSASLSHLYRELTDRTNIEWYLSEQERRDLTQLEDVIEQYGDSAVQPPLTPEFIDSLEHYDSLFDESGTTPTSQPDVADDAVNVMTIHKSKGLDFPVVLIPQVTADEWAPSSRTYDALETSLSDGPEQRSRRTSSSVMLVRHAAYSTSGSREPRTSSSYRVAARKTTMLRTRTLFQSWLATSSHLEFHGSQSVDSSRSGPTFKSVSRTTQ